jgi:hypothetical protein
MSLLTIVQSAASEVGVPEPTSVIGSLDATAVQLYRLADRQGKHLAQRYNWEALTKEATFTTVATESQGTVIAAASDFARFVNGTMFDRTATERVFGPLNEADWQRDKALNVTPVDTTFRIRGGTILFNPVPAAGNTVAFEYVSKNWCEDSAGTDQSAWAADDDVALIDEDLITLGVIYRYLQAKGLSYAEEFREYEAQLHNLQANDGMKPILNMGDMVNPYDRSNAAVSLGNWGNLANNWEEIG